MARGSKALTVIAIVASASCGRTSHDDVASGGAGPRATGGAPVAGGEGGVGASSGAGGSSDGGSGPAEMVFPLEGSWNVELQLTRTVYTDPRGEAFSSLVVCDSVPLTLHFKVLDDATVEVISGRDGVVFRGQAVTGSYGRYVAEAGMLSLPLVAAACQLDSIELQHVEIWATGAGRAETLRLFGSGAVTLIEGDTTETENLSISVSSSAPDTVRPRMIVPRGVHPLDGVLLRASEPINPDAQVLLWRGDQVLELQGLNVSDGALGKFFSKVVLPFGSTWEVTAHARDLVDHAFAATDSLTTLDDPGLWDPDGFEGSVPWIATGEPRLVEGLGSLPAISGLRSLFVPPNASVTLHLVRPPGTTKLRFTSRALSGTTGPGGDVPSVEAAVIGGTPKRATGVSWPVDETLTYDSEWPYAGARLVHDIELAELGDELVVRISADACAAAGFCPMPDHAYLVDDLHLE